MSSKATIFENKFGESRLSLEDNTIQPLTKFGNDVVLWTGIRIGHHGTFQSHVTITSHVVMSGQCEIGSYGFVGVNSTLRDGLKMAEANICGTASSVIRDTEHWAVCKGNPVTKSDVPSTSVSFCMEANAKIAKQWAE